MSRGGKRDLEVWEEFSSNADELRRVAEGANGKSVMLDVLEAVVGKANVSNVPVEAFGERFQLTPTWGKLVNIAPEMDDVKLAEGKIKQFVAGDSMYCDRKHLGGVNVDRFVIRHASCSKRIRECRRAARSTARCIEKCRRPESSRTLRARQEERLKGGNL